MAFCPKAKSGFPIPEQRANFLFCETNSNSWVQRKRNRGKQSVVAWIDFPSYINQRVELATQHVALANQHVALATHHVELAIHPAELATHPAELATHPAELVTHHVDADDERHRRCQQQHEERHRRVGDDGVSCNNSKTSGVTRHTCDV